ncbi:MAG: GTPase [Acidobacteriota bacterium]|jgi:cytidylate kinase|nr:GTPase [Acidobacteriota bacterium]
MIIAIDGPSGAGKSTLGRRLASELGLLYLDTGAMYRAAALAVIEAQLETSPEADVADFVRGLKIDLEGDSNSLRVLLNGRDVTDQIRSDEVTNCSSIISTIPEVRRTLVNRQRELGQSGRGAVLDGRDIGTVVFPQADVKFFLTAEPEERAQRRFEQDRSRESVTTIDETLAEINTRDRRDSTRGDSPLVAAPDAIVIDSTGLSVDQVFERIMDAIDERSANC